MSSGLAISLSSHILTKLKNLLQSADITEATSYETSIEIVSREECLEGLKFLQQRFQELFPDPSTAILAPILKGGAVIGQKLHEVSGVPLNPLRMTYYQEAGKRLEHPICLQEPDWMAFFTADGQLKDIIFTEAVIETQNTLQSAKRHLEEKLEKIQKENNFPPPTRASLPLPWRARPGKSRSLSRTSLWPSRSIRRSGFMVGDAI